MIDLEKLQMFVRIAEMGSLSKVAAFYDAEPSTLSRQITAFENECKGRLFIRTGRGVRLTDFGEQLLPKARGLLNDANELEREIRGNAGVPRGIVHLGILPSITAPLVAKIISVAHTRYPEVTIHVTKALSGQIEEWLATGKIDLGFVLRHSSNSVSDQPLTSSELCLVGAADDPRVSAPTIEFKELDGLPILLPGTPNAFRAMLEQLAKSHGISFKVIAEIDSVSIMKEVAAEGIGYALLSATSVQREIDSKRLKASLLVNPQVSRPVYLSATALKSHDLATREILRLIRKVVEDFIGNTTTASAVKALNSPPELTDIEAL